MVNSGSFEATGSEGESVKGEFTQLEDETVGACATEANFTAVVPAVTAAEADGGIQTSLLDLNTDKKPPITKTSLQCSVPLEKVKNVLELCNNKSKLNNYFLIENYLKQNMKPNDVSDAEPNSEPVQKPAIKRLLCLFCDRTFTSNNLRQKHVDRCHSAGQTRRSSSRIPNHNQLATACCFCSKLNHTDHTLKQLLEHLTNEHSNRYFACLTCQERFTSIQSLRDHNRLVHGLQEVEDKLSVSNDVTCSRENNAESSKVEVLRPELLRTRSNDETSKSENLISALVNENSSPASLSTTKSLKKNSSKIEINQGEKNSDSSVDLEETVQVNDVSQGENKKLKSAVEEIEDLSFIRKSKNVKNTVKKNQIVNKKISVKSTKNGVRNNLRTTRATVKQINNNFSKNRKCKLVKNDDETNVQTDPKKPECNPSSVFSLVNAYTYKYEKIYDHSSDSIKDANSVQFNAVFDKEFYSRTVYNIRDNLLHHLDGKLNRNVESECRISNFEHSNTPETDAKPISDVLNNFGCDLTLNAVTPVATLLGSSQYGEDFDAQIEYGAKASQKKPKKVAVVKYKFPNKKYNSLFRERDSHSDLTGLDMWTQLTVKTRQQRCHSDEHLNQYFFSYIQPTDFETKQQVEELNGILDKRGPFEDLRLEANAAQFLELRKKSIKDGDNISEEASKDVYFILEDLLNRVVCKCSENELEANDKTETQPESKVQLIEDLEIPNYLQLQRSPSNQNQIKIDKTDTITMICSSQDETETQQNEILELSGEWARPRIYICATCGLKLPNLKSLDDHKNINHPHIWCSHYEFVGNQSQIYRHLSIPGLGKMGVVECLPLNRVWQKSDARICSKCSKQCHNLGELHKHVLECGGDWTWMLARKKCKYRPYGARSRRRRQRGYKRSCNPEVNRVAREPKIKPIFIGPRPKPTKPSDAETIERMLANLPPKRHRKMISMRDGIQRPRKSYKPNSSPQMSPKSTNKKVYLKTNSPQVSQQSVKNTFKRKISLNNIKKSSSSESQIEEMSLKLRSRLNKKNTGEIDDYDNANENSLTQHLIDKKTKIKNKRMISRILGSKIFDSNSALVTRRKLVKAITQNNLIRKTRLRSKLNAQQQLNKQTKNDISEDNETTTQENIKKNKGNIKNSTNLEGNNTKSLKNNWNFKVNESSIKTQKRSNSKRFISVLTKAHKKVKTAEIDNKVDTISAIIDEVVKASGEEEKIRKKKNKSEIKNNNSESTGAVNKKELKNESKKSENNIKSMFGKKTNKFVENVKSFRKSFRKQTSNNKDENNKGIASKLIRSLSTKRHKEILKTDIEDNNDLKEDASNNVPQEIENQSEIVSESCDEKDSESSLVVMPILEKIEPLPSTISTTDNILPVLSPVQLEPPAINIDKQKETKSDSDASSETSDNKTCDKSNPLNKFKNKIKRSGRGLNDCIAMLKCKLEQKYPNNEPNLVDKSNLFILNSMDKYNQLTVQENIEDSSTIVESTDSIQTTKDVKTKAKNDLEKTNENKSTDIVSSTNKVLTETVNVLEIPTINTNAKVEVLNSVETQTVEEDIGPNVTTDYIPTDIQTNIQLSYVLNATLKNCLMECVKNKCEKLKIENQNVPNSKSNCKDRKIGSVRKKKKSKFDEKHIPNVPVLLNTAFSEKAPLESADSTRSPSDTSDDDIPLSKFVSNSPTCTQFKIKMPVAKKKRSSKQHIAFTPFILNNQDNCKPQERIDDKITLDNSLNNKIEEIQQEVEDTKEKQEIKSTETIENENIEDIVAIKETTENLDEVIENHIEPSNLVEEEVNIENLNKNTEETLESKIEENYFNSNNLPILITHQIMNVEDEPCEAYLINKTLTEANSEQPNSAKNAAVENIEFMNKTEYVDSGKENSEEKLYYQKVKKHKKIIKKTKVKRKSQIKNKLSLKNKNITNISQIDKIPVETPIVNGELITILKNEPIIMENKNIQETEIYFTNTDEKFTTESNISDDSEDELPLVFLIKNKHSEFDISKNIFEPVDVNEELINCLELNENLDSAIEEADETEKNIIDNENVIKVVTNNLNIDDEILVNIEDIPIENFENSITTEENIVEIKEIDKNENEIKGDVITNDNLINTPEIETELTTIETAVNNFDISKKLKTPEPLEKSAEPLDFLTPPTKNNDSFITTPDLTDTSLVIKIKRNLNIKIRKPKKTRRRVIPKELSKYNVKRREEEDTNVSVICDICNKTFKRKENLTSHKRTLTHIAKLSEIEARESLAKRLNDNEEKQTEEEKVEVKEQCEEPTKIFEIAVELEDECVNLENIELNEREIVNEVELNQNEDINLNINIEQVDADIDKLENNCNLNQELVELDNLPKDKIYEQDNEIIEINEDSCTNSEPVLTIEDDKFDVDESVIERPIDEIINLEPSKPDNNLIPGIIVNSTNSNLKLVDIISEVLDKPVNDLNLNESEYLSQNIEKSPDYCDLNEKLSEPKRYKSLGERKSFDSDNFNLTPKSNEETPINENYSTTISSVNNGLLSKQLTLLANIIEETSPNLNYMEDSMSLSSSQFDEQNISEKDLFKPNEYTKLDDPQIKFSHNSDVLSSIIKPNIHFNNFENISDKFIKPTKQYEENIEQAEDRKQRNEIKDNSKRKILNRDEELFLECCSLLKSGSEIVSKKSMRNIPLNTFSKSNDTAWIIQKQSDQFIQRDSYSWLAQSSRVDTPIGEPVVSNDWSNSNSAISSEWMAQKAPSPDRPTENNTLLNKSNNNSGETKYSDIQFEDISLDSSLETSKTLMPIENSNTENIPLDFHHVDFSQKNLNEQEYRNEITNTIVFEVNNLVESNEDNINVQNKEMLVSQKPEEQKLKPIEAPNEEIDLDLKKKVVSAFGGLMAKALTNRLHAVVRKSKKSKGKRDFASALQASITDYAVPLKKNKLSNTDSDSSDCPKKLITKGAMKVFEGIKVSIPTQDINLKEVLNNTTKIKNGDANELQVASMKNGEIKQGTILEEPIETIEKHKNGKIKNLLGRFGNKLGLRETKKKQNRHHSKSKNRKKSHDIYEFDESLESNYTFKTDKFSPFRKGKSSENAEYISLTEYEGKNDDNKFNHESGISSLKWNVESDSDTDRYYDSMSFEEMSLSSESAHESNLLNNAKPIQKRNLEKSKENQKKCMIMGRIFKNASKPKLEDKIPEIRDISSEENSKFVENYLDSYSSVDNIENHHTELPAMPNNLTVLNSANKMSKMEMDLLFDKLLQEEKKASENISSSEREEQLLKDNSYVIPEINHVEKKKIKDSRNRTGKPKKRQRHNSAHSSSSDEFTLNGKHSKTNKKHHKTSRKTKKETEFNLELEMKECIGVAGRKSQRKCTSGKQNVLVEFWSSDESSFEEAIKLLEKENNEDVEKPIEEDRKIEEIPCIEPIETINNSLSNSLDSPESEAKENLPKNSIDIYEFDSDIEGETNFDLKLKIKEPIPQIEQEFIAANKIKIPKKTSKHKRRKHKSHSESEDTEFEIEKARKRNEHKRRKTIENALTLDQQTDCLAVTRKKRNAGEQLYYWSSSSDDEFQDLIEVKPIREDTDDDRPMQHGWIVGDSPKKLVTMLAQAKGKKVEGESVKEQGKKNRITL